MELMAACTFTNGTASITVDVPASREWRVATTGSVGQATMTLLRSSPAATSTYIDPDGGSIVSIASQGGCGIWRGVILPIAYDGATIQMTALQMGAILGRRIMTRSTAVTNVTAGYVVSVILREALAGVGGLAVTAGSFEGGDHIATYALDGQDAWGALTEMMNQSDGEIDINAETGEIIWIGSLAAAPRYDPLLIAGGNLRDVSYQTDATNRLAEVVATFGNERYTARRGETAAGGWPAQARVAAKTGGPGLIAAATAELEQRALPAVSISGSVTSADWAIRERQYVRVIVPWARFTGATHVCRVLARSVDDSSPLMTLQLQVIPEVAATTVTSGAGARVRPPQRTGPDRLHSGSFAQQFRQLQRDAIKGGTV